MYAHDSRAEERARGRTTTERALVCWFEPARIASIVRGKRAGESCTRQAQAERARDATKQLHLDERLRHRTRLLAVGMDIGVALIRKGTLRASLQAAAQVLVHHIDAAFARIWTLDEAAKILELQASAGLYTHLDGAHGRVPVGQFKIGTIAATRRPHLTNAVDGDPRVPEQAWARREGLISFAGYPLVVEDQLVGVLALFARKPLEEDTLQVLASAASSIALVIERARMDEALRRSQAWLALTLQSVGDALIATDDAGCVVFMNPVAIQLTGWTIDDARGRPLDEVLDIVNETTRERVENPVAKVLREGKIVGLANHTVLKSKDGSEVAIDDSAAPIRDEQGRIFGVVMVFRDVSEARRKNEKLHELFMLAPVAIAIVEGPEHTFTLANPAYRTLLGGRDVVGKPLLVALPDLRGQGYDALLDQVVASGKPFFGSEVEVKLAHHTEGEVLILNFVYTPKRDALGRVDGVMVSANDVTEQVRARRRAEALAAELRESEERVRRVVEASGAGLWDLDVATGHIGADTRTIELMGLPPGSTMNLESALDNIHEEERAGIAAAVAAALAGENEGRYLVEFRSEETSNAPRRWVESRAQVLFDAEGKAAHLAGAIIDISARKRAEIARQSLLEEIQRSEESFRTLAEAIPQQVWTSRPDGALDFVNERVLAYFVATREQVLGAGWQSVIHPDDLPAVLERWTHSLTTGDEYEIEFRLRRADDTYRWHLGRAVVVRAARGEIVKWFGTNTDIHEAKRSREELEERTQFEQHLLGIVSHDLRNPLGAILLGATGLLEAEESEWVTTIAQRIVSSAERSTRMISDLLDFTQTRLGGGIRLTRRSLDLSALATTTIHEVEVTYPERTVELTHAGDTQGAWDADRLAQVIANLVTNALKYSPNGTPVKVSIAVQPGRVELQVHNEGAPIPVERLPRIFEPLQRATDKIDTKTRSVGLGLYIVDAIVKAHGGSVGVVSTAAAGTTFTVRLPRELEDERRS